MPLNIENSKPNTSQPLVLFDPSKIHRNIFFFSILHSFAKIFIGIHDKNIRKMMKKRKHSKSVFKLVKDYNLGHARGKLCIPKHKGMLLVGRMQKYPNLIYVSFIFHSGLYSIYSEGDHKLLTKVHESKNWAVTTLNWKFSFSLKIKIIHEKCSIFLKVLICSRLVYSYKLVTTKYLISWM